MLLAACSLRRGAAGASHLCISNRPWTLAASTRALASSMPPASLEKDGDRNHKPIIPPPLRAVPASKLIAANVYISEGRDKAVIDRLVRVLGGWKGQQGRSQEADVNSFDFAAVSSSSAAVSTSTSSASPPPAAALVHVFVDEPYNRTGFTIAGLSYEEEEEENTDGGGEAARDGRGTALSTSPLSSVPAAVSLLASESLKLIDWRLAGGTHPAIGVVDHVAVHALFPQAEGAQRAAARAARRVARALGELGVPTYLYGSASVKEEEEEETASSSSSSSSQQQRQWRKLAEVRRALGYFNTSAAAAASSSSFFARFPDPLPTPDSGPARAEAAKGAAAVGSVPWVMNVNVPLVFEGEEGGGNGGEASSSLASFSAAAAAVARAVSARRGTPASQGGFALPGVEALALAHRPGVVEVACNLTDGSVGTDEVARAVELAARRAGLRTGRKAKKRSEKEEESGADEDGEDDDDSSWYVTGKRPEEVAAEAAAALGLEINEDSGLPRFPESSFALKKLRRLVLLGHRQITAIPAEISSLKKLENLALRFCRLFSLPKELGELLSLTKLELADNYDLGKTLPADEAFPAELGKLKSLRELNLSGCRLRTVPSFLGELESLEALDLFRNGGLQMDAPLDFLIEGCPRLRQVRLGQYIGQWTPRSRAHLEAFKATLLARSPDAKVFSL